MKEVREYVENGITPEGLIQPVHDPDAHLSNKGEREEEETKASDTEAAETGNDQPPRKNETKSKVSSSAKHIVFTKKCDTHT